MYLLSSMTGASPETRFILFASAQLMGDGCLSDTMDGYADRLFVSKRYLGVAVDYLVREGYLWKIKSSRETLKGKHRNTLFDFYLSPEAWRMWSEWVAEKCSWKDEIDHVLRLPQSNEVVGSKKRSAITAQMRLVWISLWMASNKAGYVIGCDFAVLSRMLGMSENQFHRGARALAREGLVSIAANHTARTHLFEPMPPVYKLQPQSRKWKVIKLGVSLMDSQLIPLRFLFKLGDFYRKAAKRSRAGRLPSHSSYLADEQYFELSKIFHNQKLQALVQQACLSTIFSLSSGCLLDQAGANESMNYSNEELRKQVKGVLSSVLPFSDLKGFPTAKKPQGVEDVSDVGGAEVLREYTLSELTFEVVDLIEMISRQLRTFADCFGADARVLNHYPRMMMRTMLSRQDNPTDGSQLKGMTGQEPDYVVNSVLDLLVPNDKKFTDCLIFGDVLYTANSRVTHPNISQVEQLICFGGHTKS
ncbi:hypothetical protein [Shewanella algae]|uniref:Uncharacterized protein n=1 Tax=Shewanella algae TaxID=38313 RepID=A0A7T8E980_9GAMM|nr:hypothetical protein D7032_01880 [Shewanella algae]